MASELARFLAGADVDDDDTDVEPPPSFLLKLPPPPGRRLGLGIWVFESLNEPPARALCFARVVPRLELIVESRYTESAASRGRQVVPRGGK